MEFVTNHLTVSGGASQSVGPAADFVASHALVVPCCHGNAQAFVAYVSIEHSGVMIIATQIQTRKLDGDESDAALPSSLEMLQEPAPFASSVAIQTGFIQLSPTLPNIQKQNKKIYIQLHVHHRPSQECRPDSTNLCTDRC